MTDPALDAGALEALKNNQRQLDMDGVEVGVSRQALDELIAAYETLSALPGHTADEGVSFTLAIGRDCHIEAVGANCFKPLNGKRIVITDIGRPAPAPQGDDAHGYATRLLVALMEKHYPDRSPDWAPLPDLYGVLTQIDNLSTGLCRAPAPQGEDAIKAPEPWELEAAAIFMDHVDDDETGSVHRVAAFLRAVATRPAPAAAERRQVTEADVQRALAEWSKPNDRREPSEIMRAALEVALGGAEGAGWRMGRAEIAHDGFTGDIIGHYVTREGKRGVVVQQDGTRVVHVYGEKWFPAAPTSALREEDR